MAEQEIYTLEKWEDLKLQLCRLKEHEAMFYKTPLGQRSVTELRALIDKQLKLKKDIDYLMSNAQEFAILENEVMDTRKVLAEVDAELEQIKQEMSKLI